MEYEDDAGRKKLLAGHVAQRLYRCVCRWMRWRVGLQFLAIMIAMILVYLLRS